MARINILFFVVVQTVLKKHFQQSTIVLILGIGVLYQIVLALESPAVDLIAIIVILDGHILEQLARRLELVDTAQQALGIVFRRISHRITIIMAYHLYHMSLTISLIAGSAQYRIAHKDFLSGEKIIHVVFIMAHYRVGLSRIKLFPIIGTGVGMVGKYPYRQSITLRSHFAII